MSMIDKYKKLYIGSLGIFLMINILAIFVVFKKYNSENQKIQATSMTKMRFSKLKEKIEVLKDSVYSSNKAENLNEYNQIAAEEQELDSILLQDNFSDKSIEIVNQKIYDLASKTNYLSATMLN